MKDLSLSILNFLEDGLFHPYFWLGVFMYIFTDFLVTKLHLDDIIYCLISKIFKRK